MKVAAIIPVRYSSSRFPGKPFADIEGLPMIVHTLKRTELCKDIDEVYVATDTQSIYELVEKVGGNAIMTSSKHKTGTDRITEAAKNIECDIVVNVQGDEPLVDPKHISKVINLLIQTNSEVATLLCNTDRVNDFTDCKVVLDKFNNILYMSRSDIPSNHFSNTTMTKLYCIVPFKKDFLVKFSLMPQTPLELIEHIEYLRIIENGYKMLGVLVDSNSISVDTPDNLNYVRKLMVVDKIKHKYLEDALNDLR